MKKELYAGIIGAIGGAIAQLFGGWSTGIGTLLILMALDWITGLMVAGVFQKSKKTESGGLSSSIGLKGICKKVMMLIIVVIAYRFDLILNYNYIRDAVVIALSLNEAISILENAGLMGIKIPKILSKAIDLLMTKAGEKEEEDEE